MNGIIKKVARERKKIVFICARDHFHIYSAAAATAAYCLFFSSASENKRMTSSNLNKIVENIVIISP